METFPLDILLYIIDLLADDEDIESLRTLSQVCKSMVPLCRKHLFSSLHIRSRLISERFSDLLSNNPDIACYVRSLNYRIYYYVSDHELNVLDVLEKHSCLQSIEISTPGLDWNDFPDSLRSSLVSLVQLPTVAQLSLHSIKWFPLMALSGCSNLIDLQLRDIQLAPPEVNQVISRSKIRTPISLYIDERTCGDPPYLNSTHLQDGPIVDFSRLQKAEFVVKSRRDICHVFDLIKETTRLEYFSIETFLFVDYPVWLEGLGASLAINSYRTLKFLELTIIVVGNYHDPLCGLSPELRLIAGNNVLEEIELVVQVQEDTSCQTESEDWSAFDSVLTESSAFPMLHRVSVNIRWNSYYRDTIVLESLKEDKFPRLVESEAVVFNFSTENHHESFY